MAKKNTNDLLYYILTVIICLIYTLFFDAQTGFVFLCIVIIAPVISITMTYFSLKSICIETKISSNTNYKNNNITYCIYAKNSKPILMPAIYIKLKYTNHLILSNSNYDSLLSLNNNQKLDIDFNCRFAGTATIEIEEYFVYDFLGLIKFKIKNIKYDNMFTNIDIIPSVPLIDENLLYEIVNNSISSDDSENETDAITFWGGYPGYQHRKYIPGDSLKRINFKLSSKRDELYVRLDEYCSSHKLIIIIDHFNNENLTGSAQSLFAKQHMYETFLSTLIYFYKNGIEANVFYYDNSWQNVLINSNEDIEALRYKYISLNFNQLSDAFKRIPIEEIAQEINGNPIFIFTSCPDNNLYNNIQKLKSDGIMAYSVAPYTCDKHFSNYIIDINYEIKEGRIDF